MTTVVLMPQLGETVTEGTVSAWFKAVGDSVAAGDPLLEIETDKVSMEVQALQSGTLTEIRANVGETLPVGAVVAVIGADGEGGAPRTVAGADDDPLERAIENVIRDLSPAETPPAETPPAENAAAASDEGIPPLADQAHEAPSGNGADRGEGFGAFSEVRTPERNFGPATVAGGLKVTPLARRLAAERGIDLAGIARGVRAGGGQRIGRAEVEAHADAAPAAASPAHGEVPSEATEKRPDIPVADEWTAPAQSREVDPTPAAEAPAGAESDRQPLNRVRRKTAAHLAKAWAEVPHVLQAVEVDFHRVEAARQALNAANAGHWGFRLTYLPFIARAACLAIREFPQVNASFDGEGLAVHRRINLGIAVDLAHEGLVVPVVRGADDLNLAGLARAIAALSTRARAGVLGADDLVGGTYTISNSGTFGTLITAPIVNHPEVAILSTDGVRKKPVAVETEHGDLIVVHPVGVLAQSFDHRAFDGAYSAAFLNRVRQILETRDWSGDIG